MQSCRFRGTVLMVLSLLVAASCGSHRETRELVDVTLTPAAPSIAAGTSIQLTAMGRFSDDTTEDVSTQVVWASATTAVATVGDGLARGLTVGTSVISASISSKVATTVLTVTDARLQSIAITPPDRAVAKGSRLQFAATGTYGDGSTQDLTGQVTWASLAAAVAFSATGTAGLATAEHVGTSTIRATDPATGISGQATLTVTDAVLVAVEVTPTNPEIAKGTSQQLVATGIYSDSSTQDLTTQVTWASATEEVATISNASGSHGLASTSINTLTGTSAITATLDAISGSTVLTVTVATLVSIEIEPASPTIAKGMSQQFTAIGVYSDSSTHELTTQVTWSSVTAEVATVSNASPTQGLASTSFTTVPGQTTVTATSGTISTSTTLTVTSAVLTSVTVQPSRVSMAKGTTVQFAAEYHFSDGQVISTTDATWSSSSADLTVSNADGSRGLALAVADSGVALLRATDPASGYVGEATVTLTAAVLVRIDVDPANQTLPRSTTENYAATGVYSDFTTQDLTEVVTWASSDTSVATVSNAAGSQGTATTLVPGTTTISATDPATGILGQARLAVSNATLVAITITPVNPTIGKGARLQLVATGHYEDGRTRNLTQFVSWSSSSPNVAGVSNAPKKRGIATGKSAGTTTITATDPATLVSGSTQLTISTATLQSITLTPSTSTIPRNTKQYFTATGNFSDGSSSDLTAAVSWSSSNPAIATISNQNFNNGVATGVAPGTVTITAFDSTSSIGATATLTVSSATLVAIALTPDTPSLITQTTLPMTATGTFSDNSTKDLTREVTWTSGNAAIATVLNVGSTKGMVTAVAVGTTSIAANYPQTTFSGSTPLTVTP